MGEQASLGSLGGVRAVAAAETRASKEDAPPKSSTKKKTESITSSVRIRPWRPMLKKPMARGGEEGVEWVSTVVALPSAVTHARALWPAAMQAGRAQPGRATSASSEQAAARLGCSMDECQRRRRGSPSSPTCLPTG
jgi:hypothetical protein